MHGAALLWFFGPEEERTLAVVERLLRSNRSRDLAVAIVLSEEGAGDPEWGPPPEPLGRRLEEAGAVEVLAARVEPGDTESAYWSLIESATPWWDAALVVSPEPIGGAADRAVAVAPVPEGGSFLVEEERGVPWLPGDLVLGELLGELLGGEGTSGPPAAEQETELPQETAALITRLLEERLALRETGPWLRRGHEYLARADIVVVPVADERERQRAEPALRELREFWRDPRRRVQYQRFGPRERLATYAPRLEHPGDRDTQRLLSALKRVVAGR